MNSVKRILQLLVLSFVVLLLSASSRFFIGKNNTVKDKLIETIAPVTNADVPPGACDSCASCEGSCEGSCASCAACQGDAGCEGQGQGEGCN